MGESSTKLFITIFYKGFPLLSLSRPLRIFAMRRIIFLPLLLKPSRNTGVRFQPVVIILRKILRPGYFMDDANKTLLEAIDKIRAAYLPAATFEEADQIMKTHQVVEEIKMHFADWSIDTAEFITEFQKAGFKYDLLPENLEFVWLLKRK